MLQNRAADISLSNDRLLFRFQVFQASPQFPGVSSLDCSCVCDLTESQLTALTSLFRLERLVIRDACNRGRNGNGMLMAVARLTKLTSLVFADARVASRHLLLHEVDSHQQITNA